MFCAFSEKVEWGPEMYARNSIIGLSGEVDTQQRAIKVVRHNVSQLALQACIATTYAYSVLLY